MIVLTAALAVVVGITLGLLGGGGSILTVPLLAYVADMDAKQAIATSLLVVGVTSAVAAISHARAGRVQWRTGLIFGAAGMAGAYTGGLLSRFVPGVVLMLAFAVMMVATAIAMLRGRKETGGKTRTGPLPVGRIVLDGVVVGLVTGIVGAGGGFLVVPALTLLGGLPMPIAIGTSLVVIAMKSAAGFAGYATTVQINWQLAAIVTVAAVLGSLIGGRMTTLVKPETLRKGFGWFVLAMSAVIVSQELHWIAGAVVAATVLIAAAIVITRERRGDDAGTRDSVVEALADGGDNERAASKRPASPALPK